jgi:hypothetical protein
MGIELVSSSLPPSHGPSPRVAIQTQEALYLSFPECKSGTAVGRRKFMAFLLCKMALGVGDRHSALFLPLICLRLNPYAHSTV